MVDASSVAKEDLLPYTLHFPGRVGYNYAAKYNPEHRSAFLSKHSMMILSHCLCEPHAKFVCAALL